MIEVHGEVAERALIHREIFVETLSECERLLSAAEAEARTIRRDADAAARKRAEEVLRLAMTAADELAAAADADRVETSRKRLQAENSRVGAERIQAALSQQLEELAVERAALDHQRAQLDSALAAAEAHRAEALELHERAEDGARALLAAASVRTELLESMLADRIGEVASTLSTLQDLVLDRESPSEQDRTTLRDLLSTTFREIREYRDAELTAADDRAAALIGQAQQVAHEIVATTRREHDQVVAGTDARSVLDVVGVLLAESRPTTTPDGATGREEGPGSRPIDVLVGTGTPSDADAAEETDHTAAALTEALGGVDDPGDITDAELAEVLRTADRLVGDHATIDDAFDLARALSDALQPDDGESIEDRAIEDPGTTGESIEDPAIEDPATTGESIEDPATNGEWIEDPGTNGDSIEDRAIEDPWTTGEWIEDSGTNGQAILARSPDEGDTTGDSGGVERSAPDTDVAIDLTSGDFPVVSLDVSDEQPRVGRFRSFWRTLF